MTAPVRHLAAPDEVLNQPPPLEDYNLLEFDTPLREALHREGAGWPSPTPSAGRGSRPTGRWRSGPCRQVSISTP